MKWKGDDDDVPVGTVGRVTSIHADGDVEVAFPKRAQVKALRRRLSFVGTRRIFNPTLLNLAFSLKSTHLPSSSF